MTKNEALKKCIDGAKIKHKAFRLDEYVYWSSPYFMYVAHGINEQVEGALDDENGWQIFPEHVDFATAWAAYENCNVIQSEKESFTRLKAHETTHNCISMDSIRGKWLILEDE